ncbi:MULTISPECIES: M15 family metallopeptidase [unclassified Spirosoma]|uniref:M15 family metallopeptidase n=1 Tax=unclassified Spirosoma TaxID=2621999 RepID=UPI000965E346|nr:MULTISPECIES: M15 family metallopeptidase [unclassified Spirosoma]MBN8826721.1 M15 family metallopeptidase [Spirosoma sp.]OJW73813.1 MAG: peptidase M15 [Spirosoma sp. 48-14]
MRKIVCYTIAFSFFYSFVLFPALAQPFEAAMIKQGLVDVQTVDPTILVELKYSTTDNFVGKDVYGDLTRAYMQPMAARKLALASKYLQAAHPNLRLLVYDAARPRSAQWNLWNALPDLSERERRKYVADPRQGSIHNYGCAVDLTVATEDGKPLDMGTKYDFFGELAYPSREAVLLKAGKLTQKQLDNRLILRTAMRQGGFTPIEYEWWHFNALSREKAKMAFRIVD